VYDKNALYIICTVLTFLPFAAFRIDAINSVLSLYLTPKSDIQYLYQSNLVLIFNKKTFMIYTKRLLWLA